MSSRSGRRRLAWPRSARRRRCIHCCNNSVIPSPKQRAWPLLALPTELCDAARACEQAAQAAKEATKPKKAKAEDEDDDDMDPTMYFENRLKSVGAVKAAGGNPYPHKFDVSAQLPAYVQQYESLGEGEQLSDVTVKLAGAPSQPNATPPMSFHTQPMPPLPRSTAQPPVWHAIQGTAHRWDAKCEPQIGLDGSRWTVPCRFDMYSSNRQGRFLVVVCSYYPPMLPAIGDLSPRSAQRETGSARNPSSRACLLLTACRGAWAPGWPGTRRLGDWRHWLIWLSG